MGTFQPVVFRLDKELYGLDINQVEAIETRQDVVRVPNASKNIKGITNLRGEVIPVISMRAKFACENQMTPDSVALIIVRCGGQKMALEVDEAEEIHNIEDTDVSDIPTVTIGEGVEYLTKVVKSQNRLIIIVDPSKLLSKEEMQIADQLRDKE